MQNPVSLTRPRCLSASRSHRWFGLFLLLSAIGLTSGCSGGSSTAEKTEVTGKVTLGDKPVTGMVVFVSGDNKETNTMSGADGAYTMTGVGPGPVKVYLKELPGTVGTKAPPKDVQDSATGAVATPGVPPPKKYQSPTTSGLTYEVKMGKQTYNIELK